MLKISQLVEWAEVALSDEHEQLREAEQVAWKIRHLLELRLSVSAAILWVVADAFERDLWHTKKNDFESFELWLEYVFDGTNVKRGTTLWTIANSFAVGLSPWLKQHRIEDARGEITPMRVLEDAGYSLLQDINGAWWSEFKADGPETDEIIEKVIRKIIEPATTRETIEQWLYDQGYRKKQDEREFQHAEQVCTDGIALIVMCPTGQDIEFLRKKMRKHLAMFPGRLQEVSPELVYVGEWGVEMVEERER